MVYEGTGAAGADSVHALVDAAGEIYDFRVLAAQLNGNVALRRIRLEGCGHRHDLLGERDVEMLCQRESAGTCDDGAERNGAQLLSGLDKKVGKCFLDVGKMPLVVGETDIVLLIQNGNFYSGGTDVDSQSVLTIHIKPHFDFPKYGKSDVLNVFQDMYCNTKHSWFL